MNLLYVLSTFWGEGLRVCLGGIILEDVSVNYYLLKRHLGDTPPLSCSLILHAVKGNPSIVH